MIFYILSLLICCSKKQDDKIKVASAAKMTESGFCSCTVMTQWVVVWRAAWALTDRHLSRLLQSIRPYPSLWPAIIVRHSGCRSTDTGRSLFKAMWLTFRASSGTHEIDQTLTSPSREVTRILIAGKNESQARYPVCSGGGFAAILHNHSLSSEQKSRIHARCINPFAILVS